MRPTSVSSGAGEITIKCRVDGESSPLELVSRGDLRIVDERAYEKVDARRGWYQFARLEAHAPTGLPTVEDRLSVDRPECNRPNDSNDDPEANNRLFVPEGKPEAHKVCHWEEDNNCKSPNLIRLQEKLEILAFHGRNLIVTGDTGSLVA